MKIGIVCAPGGHLTQALYVMDAFCDCDVFIITYKSDALLDFKFPNIKKIYFVKFYGASRIKVMMNILFNIPSLIKIIIKEKPKLLFSTGSEIAIPAFYIAKFLFRTRLIFLETVVRTDVPTLTSKVLHPICDLFLVQWKNILHKYGEKAKYVGSII